MASRILMHVVAKPSLVALLALRGGLDAKWTPNGEAPEPYPLLPDGQHPPMPNRFLAAEKGDVEKAKKRWKVNGGFCGH